MKYLIDCEINSWQETSKDTLREEAYPFLLLRSREKRIKLNCKKEKKKPTINVKVLLHLLPDRDSPVIFHPSRGHKTSYKLYQRTYQT